MNKKQVGALLKVMSKDGMRPTLCTGYVDTLDGRTVLVVTDGYKLAAVYMDGAEELVGKMIRREAIERWYKLATGKSRLDGEELLAVASEDYGQHNGYYDDSKYPEWQKLIPQGTTEPQEGMAFNAEYFKIMQDLDGADSLEVSLYGKLAPMVIRTERGLYMVMPMKGR